MKEREEAVARLQRATEAEAEAEKARADADAKVADANARLARAVADADAAGITSARLKEREDALADQKAEIERVLDELGPRETDCARREKQVSVDEERAATRAEELSAQLAAAKRRELDASARREEHAA